MPDHTTPITLDETARAVICDIADQFEHSWNVGDGPAYAEPFAEGADHIGPDGHRVTGRRAIAERVSTLLATIYRESTISLRVSAVRCPGPSVVVARLEHVLDAPHGPVDEQAAVATLVVADSVRGWEVTTLQQTAIDYPAR